MPNLLLDFWCFILESSFLLNNNSVVLFMPFLLNPSNEALKKKLKNSYILLFVLFLNFHIIYHLFQTSRMFLIFMVFYFSIIPGLFFLGSRFSFLQRHTTKISFFILRGIIRKTLLIHATYFYVSYLAYKQTDRQFYIYISTLFLLSVGYLCSLYLMLFHYKLYPILF